VELDRSGYPLVVSTWRGVTTLEEAEAFIDDLEALVREAQRRGDGLFLVADLRRVEGTPARVRQRFATFLDELGESWQSAFVATAVLFRSPLMRGVITAIGWLSPIVHAVRPAADLDEAREHFLRECRRLERTPPPALERLTEATRRISRSASSSPSR
jgi:hypothetical protein